MSKAFSMNSGKGLRTVASYDEDASTMAVEAARRVAAASGPFDTVMFSTTHPPLLDKGSAATIAAVLDLSADVTAVDMGGSARSTIGCLKAAFAFTSSSLLLASDMRYGRPGSDDEINGSDGAAAFTFGANPQVSLVAMESVSSPVMDRWRSEGDKGSQVWDDRWTADQQVPLMLNVVERVLKAAGVAASDISGVVVSASSTKVAAQVLGKLGGGSEANVEPFGYFGSADIGIKLARVLSRAKANQNILVVSGADGADAMVLRTSATFSADAGFIDDGAGALEVSVIDYLAWRGLVHREPPRRPDPEIPAAPAV
jgi:3-hydroxy-3-methylglutaryl CoA synthase